MSRASSRSARGKRYYTKFAPAPVKVTKIDKETGEVISVKTVRDPLSYDKRRGQQYYRANIESERTWRK